MSLRVPWYGSFDYRQRWSYCWYNACRCFDQRTLRELSSRSRIYVWERASWIWLSWWRPWEWSWAWAKSNSCTIGILVGQDVRWLLSSCPSSCPLQRSCRLESWKSRNERFSLNRWKERYDGEVQRARELNTYGIVAFYYGSRQHGILFDSLYGAKHFVCELLLSLLVLF